MPVKIPTTTHYAIIIQTTTQTWHEGDQRSRDFPGHGYPAGYETHHNIDYEVFQTVAEVEQWVSNPRNAAKNYTIISATPMKAETKIVVRES